MGSPELTDTGFSCVTEDISRDCRFNRHFIIQSRFTNDRKLYHRSKKSIKSMRIYVKNISDKFHPNPMWNDGALGFLKRSPNKKNNNTNSAVRSVLDLKNDTVKLIRVLNMSGLNRHKQWSQLSKYSPHTGAHSADSANKSQNPGILPPLWLNDMCFTSSGVKVGSRLAQQWLIQ